ncbi:N-acetylmannosamine-6-phosphate 2-epimerase [Coprothermobacter platensis]|uniref:N-acetylmannosamine-6-phosphate 2-epimerase n=1 Tax=Coprothermobacter platensis TaxID=108819 RepID=UPI00035CF28C|nr:N-acetylmannosamine-6-phosphate 2-epimerase [Coprothermobacter platensis]
MNTILERLKGGLIVSCQAYEDSPLYGAEIMARMARAAEIGGAIGLRACWTQDIEAIKSVTSLPIIGINKVIKPTTDPVNDVIITPDYESASVICETGVEILGLDCTARKRSYDDIANLIAKIKVNYPNILIMADISTLEEGLHAADIGADIISTTLSGYTTYSRQQEAPDIALVRDLYANTDKPINAEGRYWEPAQVYSAFDNGAWCVTIGSAITRPELITRRFTQSIEKYWQNKQSHYQEGGS